MSIRAILRAVPLAAALGVASTGTSLAQTPADSAFTPASPLLYDWSGAYVGATVGASWATFDTAFGFPGASRSFDASGFTGGVLGGVNMQNGPFVFGVEVDANFSTGDDASVIAGVPVTVESNWFSTLRGRAGYAFDRYMLYGTGGLAVGNVDVSVPGASFSDTRVGWTLGAGFEAAITDNFTLRGEYLYTDLGSTTGTVGASPFTTEFDSHTLRAGVTYRFK